MEGVCAVCAVCGDRPIQVPSLGLCRACASYRWRRIRANRADPREEVFDAPPEVTMRRRRSAGRLLSARPGPRPAERSGGPPSAVSEEPRAADQSQEDD
jgi:hypothetical protein